MNKLLFLLIQLVLLVKISSGNGACKLVTEMETCSWIDYNSWHPGSDPKSLDSKIGSVALQIKDPDCRWAYTAYFCAVTFPKCNENEDGPLPVCRDTCQELLDKCPSEFWQGVTADICDALPETECTSPGAVLTPSFLSFLPYLVLFVLRRRQ